jgi:hypothetical protein
MRRWAALVIIWGLGAVSGSMVGWTSALFTSTKSNPGNNFTAASSFCPTPSTQSAATDRDSWVGEESSGNDNHGTENTLNVQSRSGQDRRTLIYFPLPSKPGGCVVSSAILRLYATSAASGRTIGVRRIQATWTETGVTWVTQPAADPTPVATGSSGTAPAWKEWNVASLVNLMYSGSNHGFLLKDESEDAGSTQLQVYQSEEDTPNTQDPQLVITFSDEVCSSPGSQTVTASADSHVEEDAATTNFGTNGDLYVQSKSTQDRRSYVKFVLPSVPSNCSVSVAILRMFHTVNTTGRTIQVFRAAASWTESGVTWSNQPGPNGTASTYSPTGNGWAEVTVTPRVQEMYSGTDNGFLLRDQTEDSGGTSDQKYDSREGTNDPQLRITIG